MTPDIDQILQKTELFNRKFLLSLSRDSRLGKNTNVVYIYSLVDETINYPENSGQILYIGEAGRPSEPTGKRFAQHISSTNEKGADSGTIYALSRYYWKNSRIRIRIFIVMNKPKRKSLERELLTAHVKKFGTLPICQGTTGQNYKTSKIKSMAMPDNIASLL